MEINETNIDTFAKELEKVSQIDSMMIEIKNLMKPLQDKLKQLKIEKKELEDILCPTMHINNFRKAELPDNKGYIEYKVRDAVVPINRKEIKDKMIEFYKEGPGSLLNFNSKNPTDKGSEMYDYIYDKKNRQFTKKEELKVKNG
jgi:hypothetical protein